MPTIIHLSELQSAGGKGKRNHKMNWAFSVRGMRLPLTTSLEIFPSGKLHHHPLDHNATQERVTMREDTHQRTLKVSQYGLARIGFMIVSPYSIQ
ncbi:hypothetical protein RRG08_050391 [Elysia crispata]|uniref:Uncharacterized protein n=1 Tax=Elysia crispata TaxID=231223 RepID=A0AAE0YUN3_9GAST|nr:hypothetical protein RRG08_050391 [Elysia crispata]